jgi:dGTPase
MDWADDITYSVHDTEDFYRAGLIPLDRLAMAETERRAFLRAAFARWDTRRRLPPFPPAQIEAVFGQLCDTLRISEPFRGTRSQSGSLNEFVSHTIHDLVDNTRLLPFPGRDGAALAVPPEQRLRVVLLKELTWVYVIRNPALATHRRGQQHVVRTLFAVYDDAALRKDWALFPAQAQEEAEDLVRQFDGEVPAGDRARLVADTIASLTDLQAVRLYQQLTGNSLEGLLAPLGR